MMRVWHRLRSHDGIATLLLLQLLASSYALKVLVDTRTAAMSAAEDSYQLTAKAESCGR